MDGERFFLLRLFLGDKDFLSLQKRLANKIKKHYHFSLTLVQNKLQYPYNLITLFVLIPLIII